MKLLKTTTRRALAVLLATGLFASAVPVAAAAMVEWLAQVATVPSNLTPEEFKARMQREILTYQRVIEKVGIQQFAD